MAPNPPWRRGCFSNALAQRTCAIKRTCAPLQPRLSAFRGRWTVRRHVSILPPGHWRSQHPILGPRAAVTPGGWCTWWIIQPGACGWSRERSGADLDTRIRSSGEIQTNSSAELSQAARDGMRFVRPGALGSSEQQDVADLGPSWASIAHPARWVQADSKPLSEMDGSSGLITAIYWFSLYEKFIYTVSACMKGRWRRLKDLMCFLWKVNSVRLYF